MMRTITTIRTEYDKFNHAEEIDYIMDVHDQGGVTYEAVYKSVYKNGYIDRSRYRKFDNKEMGNREYKLFLANGYKLVSKDTFVPTDMDMR